MGTPLGKVPVRQMLTLSLTLFAALLSTTDPVNGQPSERIYLDYSLGSCSKKHASFYMEPQGMDGTSYRGRIYTMDGVLKAEGHFADPQLRIQHGLFTFYHPNGKVESTGRYEMGRKSGVWQRYDEWGQELAEKVYDPEALKDILYTRAEIMPQYPGGQKELVSYLRSKATTPDGINTHGTLTVGFVVERDGSLTEAKVIDGNNEVLDQRVVDALMDSPRWSPGEERGLPVRVQMKMPVPY